MLLATFAFAALHALVKSLDDIHIFELLFFPAGLSALLCIGFLRSRKIPMRGNNPPWLLLRAACGLVACSMSPCSVCPWARLFRCNTFRLSSRLFSQFYF
jgi:hypothetical protein